MREYIFSNETPRYIYKQIMFGSSTIQDMNSIIMFIKIACFKCTKTFKYKTRQERDVIDNLDKLMSSENTATMLELVKKNIYNTIKE